MEQASGIRVRTTRRGALRVLAWLPAYAASQAGAATDDAAAALAAATPGAEIDRLSELLHRHRGLSCETDGEVQLRMQVLGSELLGSTFTWNPIGEGPLAWDADPPLVLSRFDCLTYVETVLAMARARSLADVFDDLAQLRYAGRAPRFEHRLHFVSDEWLPAAVQGGILKAGPGPCPAPLAIGTRQTGISFTLDRQAWFRSLPVNSMYRELWRQFDAHPDRAALEAWGRSLPGPAKHILSYVASPDLRALLRRPYAGQALSGAVVLLVRPGTLFGKEAAAGDPISHAGLLVQRDGRWWLRGTSYVARGVVDRPLEQALQARSRLPAALGCVVCPVAARLGPLQRAGCGILKSA
jgi:hypothetical protein